MSLTRYTPEERLEKYRAIRKSVGSREFFTRPEHQKTQEIWCAAHFGRLYSNGIGLCHLIIEDRDQQTDVDFELEVGGHVHAFQITEVQAPDRKRGDKYKNKISTKSSLEDWRNGADFGPQWIRRGIERKFKRYGGSVSDLNLLVYLNFLAYDQQFLDLRNACADVAAPFASVWLLNGNAVACISSQGTLCGPVGWLMGPESPAIYEP